MTYVLAFLAAIAGTVGGFFAATALGGAVATLLGISSFEGEAGYFAVFVFGPVGGLIGLVIGLWLVFRYKGGHRTFSAIASRSAIVIVAIVVVAAVGVQLRLATLDFNNGATPQLEYEIRLPAHAAVGQRVAMDVEMQAGTQRSGGFWHDAWLRHDGDRPVLAGFVPLYTRTSQRMLVFSRAGEPKLLFNIRLSATPAPSDQYGAWQCVDFIDDMKAELTPRPPRDAETYDIRYRVPDWTKP